MTQKVTVTRMEFLARKEQIAIATAGQELLSQKRAALLRELMRTADQVMTQREAVEATAAEARRALATATAAAGEVAVRSAAMATRNEMPLTIQNASVMGITVPVIERKSAHRSPAGRGYALPGTPAVIDEAAEAYEELTDKLLALAESELRLKRLAAEIQRTTRQANALEHAILPRLRRERDTIKMTLDERERAEHFRLKRVKSSRARKKTKGLNRPR